MKRKTKAFGLLLLLLLLFIYTGCNKRDDYHTETKNALFRICDSLEKGDPSSFKSLLCDSLKDRPDVDKQINSFFDQVGGELIRKDQEHYSIMRTGAEKIANQYTVVNTFGSVHDLEDKNHNTYTSLVIHYTYINTNDPSKIGVGYVALFNHSYTPICEVKDDEYFARSENEKQESSVPDITQEQENEIAALEEKNHCMMPYRRAVASGDISPDSPKLTLDDTKRIIKEAENVESLNVRIYESGRYENYNQQAEYICQEISKIQPYADTIRSSGMIGSRELEYWLTSDGTTGERKQIHLTSGGRMIWYEEIDKDGKTKNSEVLFEASLEKNWQDSEEDYPVITRPIVPDSASAE